MGMYTELVVGIALKEDAPLDVIQALRYMVGDSTDAPPPLEHALFATSRWPLMLRCGSYYFQVPDPVSVMRYDYIRRAWWLSVRSSFKNYEDEVVLFMDWIAPYVDNEEFLGYSRYEEDEQPVLYYATRAGIRVVHP
jgi:hypothetical protein